MSRLTSAVFGLAACLLVSSSVAAPLTLTVDPSRSSVTFSDLFAVINGNVSRLSDLPPFLLIPELEEQEPGSSETILSGSLEVDLDLGAETLALLGGSVVDAAVTGTNLITDTNGNQGEADLALQLDSQLLTRTYYSFTDLVLDVEQSTMALTDGGGFYQIAGGQSILMSDGDLNLFFGLDLFPSGTFSQIDIASLQANNLLTGGTLTVTGNEVELVLPFEVEVALPGDPLNVGDLGGTEGGYVLAGEIVATAIVPEPTTWVLLAPLTLTVDPSRSSVTFSDLFAVINGNVVRLSNVPLLTSLEEQEPGSSETILSGSLEVDLDLGAETLALLGGSVVDAAVTGTNLVTDTNGNQGEADLAVQVDSQLLYRTYYSFTDLVLDVEQSTMALTDGGGFYQIAGGQSILMSDGDFNNFVGAPVFPDGTFSQIDIASLQANNLLTGGTLTVTGNLVELVLPFEVEVALPGDPLDVGSIGATEGGYVLTGEIVATAIVPEPTTW
ncbi:unnamed protein product, partial [Durusdinium trenchii]